MIVFTYRALISACEKSSLTERALEVSVLAIICCVAEGPRTEAFAQVTMIPHHNPSKIRGP